MIDIFTTPAGLTLSYERRGSGPLLVCHPGGPGCSAAEFRDFAGLDGTFVPPSGTLHDDIDDQGWLTCFTCARSFAVHDERLIGLIQPGFLQVEGAASEAPLAKTA